MENITLTRDELQEIIASTVRTSIAAALESMGVKPRKDKIWMSQAEASRMVGRRRLEKAMREGKVHWEKPDMDKKQGRVSVRAADVIKLIKEPK